MTDDKDRPVNLASLDPTADAQRFDGLVASIMEISGDELEARRAEFGVIAEIGRWRRPMMAAAAIAAVLSVVTLARIPSVTPGDSAAASGFVEALGVPTELAQWLGSEQLPTTADIAYGYAER